MMSKQNLSLLIRRFTLILPNFFPCRDSCHNLQVLAVLPNVGVDVVAPAVAEVVSDEVAEVEEEVSADVEVVAADSEDEEALADVEVALEDEVVVSVDEVVVAEAVVSVDEDEEDLVLVENIFFYKFCNFLYDFSIQTERKPTETNLS